MAYPKKRDAFMEQWYRQQQPGPSSAEQQADDDNPRTRLLLSPDCSFQVGPTKEIVNAHKYILSSISPVFRAMFYGLFEEKYPIVVPDIESEIFNEMINFIYTREVNIKSEITACELHYSAKKYMLNDLMQICSNFLAWQPNPKTVCVVYEYATLADDTVVIDKCIETMRTRTREVISGNLDGARMDTIEKLFSLEPLCIDSELEILQAAAKYSTAYDKRNAPVTEIIDISEDSETQSTRDTSSPPAFEVETSSIIEVISSDDDTAEEPSRKRKRPQNKKKLATVAKKRSPTLTQLLKYIRLLTVPPEEFAESKDVSVHFTTQERNVILMNICSTNAYEKLPEIFCSSRSQRTSNQRVTSTLKTSLITTTEARSRPHVSFTTILNYVDGLQYFQSVPFYARNLPWRLVVRPEYVIVRGFQTKYLAVFVECNWEDPNPWSCQADVRISLQGWDSAILPFTQTFIAGFCRKLPMRGYNTFINWDNISRCRYVKNNAILLNVVVVTAEPGVDILGCASRPYEYNSQIEVENNSVFDQSSEDYRPRLIYSLIY